MSSVTTFICFSVYSIPQKVPNEQNNEQQSLQGWYKIELGEETRGFKFPRTSPHRWLVNSPVWVPQQEVDTALLYHPITVDVTE
jgi:hypothetical protein